MDTPTITQYYREADPAKRLALLNMSIEAGEEPELNKIRRELWDIRYQDKSELGGDTRADGLIALWMLMEFYRECCHRVKTYMELSESDKAYNSTLFGILKMSSEQAKDKLKADIYHTAVELPQTLKLEEELGMITRAAREMYELHFPGEGSLRA